MPQRADLWRAMREIRGRDDPGHAGHGAGGFGMDRPDRSVGIRAAHEGQMRGARQAHVIDILDLAAQQPAGVRAGDAGAAIGIGPVGVV